MPRATLQAIAMSTLLVAAAGAQVVNPADKQRAPSGGGQPQGKPVVVEGQRVSGLREEDRVGPYGQPRWTTRRRFTETRVYVRPEGQVEFEFWLVPEIDSSGHTETTKQYELEFGLPQRLQLDLYAVSHKQGNNGPEEFDEQKFELRWAFADWDEIWGNPTAYLEWASKSNSPDAVEAKLLLGGEVCEGWHWGTNLVFEHETGGAQENGYEVTGGASYTAIDDKLSVGAEVKWANTDVKADRGDFTTELLLGPSVQIRPLPKAHVDLVALGGLTDDSPDAKFFFVFGWEF